MKRSYFDPMAEIENEIRITLSSKINEIYGLELNPSEIKIEKPPRKELGDLAVPVGFLISERLGLTGKEKGQIIQEAPKRIATAIDSSKSVFKEIRPVGGFLNFFIDETKFAHFVLENVINIDEFYGMIDLGKGETVIVEHTSANPVHPLHIGTARNAILGDTLSRLLKWAGYNVRRHFYINDMGKQVAYLVYGYKKLKDLGIKGKSDHWLGVIYSCVNVLAKARTMINKVKEAKETLLHIIDEALEKLSRQTDLDDILVKLSSLKRKLQTFSTTDWREIFSSLKSLETQMGEISALAKEKEDTKNLENILLEIKEWLEIEFEVKSKWGEIYEELQKRTMGEDIEEEVSELMRKYEEGDVEISNLFKEVVEEAIRGFKDTLNLINITFDSFDWESQLVREGEVKKIIERLREVGWAKKEEDSEALYLDIRGAIRENEKVAKLFNLSREKVNQLLREGKIKELPPNLPLTRSDGTTLYTTRDISYSVYKFTRWGAKKVYNVIGVDQTLAQKQLKVALMLSGYEDFAENQIHVAYELVTLPGKKFSSRRGRYVTFDEVFEEVKVRAYEEIHKRWPEADKLEKKEADEKIAVGAVRYALLEVSPTKKIVFQWERVLDFEKNSGPFLQYAYVRALNILKKAGVVDFKNANFGLLNREEERDLIMKIAEFPKKIRESIYFLRPDILVEYSIRLAQAFNKFYQKHRVLQAETEELKKARLALVKAYLITLGNTLDLLGIPKLEKM